MGPEALYQTAAAPETIMKPDNCEYGLLEVTGEEHLVLSQKLEHKDVLMHTDGIQTGPFCEV